MSEQRTILTDEQVASWQDYAAENDNIAIEGTTLLVFCHTIRQLRRELAEYKARRCGNCNRHAAWEADEVICLRERNGRTRARSELCEMWEPQPQKEGEKE